MSEKKSPPHKEKAGVSKSAAGDGKSNKRKLVGPGSPSEDEDKKNSQKRKRPNMVDGSSPEHMGLGSPRGAGSVSRLSVPLSERQQMAILMKMADESGVGDTSPKSPSSGNQVTSTTKRTPADKKVNKRNERGEAPLHMAAKRGDYRQTKHLLKAGASVNMKDYAGWTALHEACASGNIRVARYLLKAGADVNVQGFDDETPLHDASSNGHRKLVQLLLRHGANPHQSNLKGKTAIDVATTSQIEAILKGCSVNYSSDSGSNSEVSSCDSIISAKEEDRSLEDEFRIHGQQNKVDVVGSSSTGTTVRRQSVPPSPDKTASSPRLFMKLQHKKSSSSSSSANEEQQRVSEWNVLTMETGSCDILSDADSSNSRPFEQRSSTSVSSSRLSKPEESWGPRLQGLQPNSDRSSRLDSEGCPDSTVSSTPALQTLSPVHPPLERTHTPMERTLPSLERTHPPLSRAHPPLERSHPPLERSHPPLERSLPPLERTHPPLERTATEPFTPRDMLPSIGDSDTKDDLGDVFPNPSCNVSSSSITNTNNKSNVSTSNSFNSIPICSSSSTSSSHENNKQLSPQQHPLLHLHPHNSPLRPSSQLSYQYHKSLQQPTPGLSGPSLYPREQLHPRPVLPHVFSNISKVTKESVKVSLSPLSSVTSLSVPHHHRTLPVSNQLSSSSIAPTISSTSLPLQSPSTVLTVAGVSHSYQPPATATISSSLPVPSHLPQSQPPADSRPPPHVPLTPFSARTPKAGGSIVTGLSDRALAACHAAGSTSNVTSATTLLPTATNSLSSQSLNSTIRPLESSSRLLLPQRVEELSSSQPKSDTSSCDSPLCMDMDDSNHALSDHDSRPSTPKVPPLKIIMPGKAGVPSADDFSKPLNKTALPYVLNPTQEGGEAFEDGEGGLALNPVLEAVGGDGAFSVLPSSEAGGVEGVDNAVDNQLDKDPGAPNWEAEESGSRESDLRNDQADGESSEKSEDGKEKKSTRTLRSHTAMLQQQHGKPAEKNGVIEPKDEDDNKSTTRSQKGDDSATDESSFPPRKRKLRNKNEQQPTVPVTVAPAAPMPKLNQPLEKPPNPYETYLNLRRQIANRHRSLCNVPPKPPIGFKDYLMVNCTYILQGNATSTLSVPMLPPPNLVKEPMREFFIQQEKARYRLRLQHVIEREKLMLSIEQEILREHGRAARAIANQTLPLSVCTILREEEIYNQQELEQDENRDKNVRSRYNGRQFLSWLQDVDDKYEKIKSLLLLRHHHEAESLYAVQKLDWEWKMKELGLCDNKNTPVIDDLHVPMVNVSDEFDLLPAS